MLRLVNRIPKFPTRLCLQHSLTTRNVSQNQNESSKLTETPVNTKSTPPTVPTEIPNQKILDSINSSDSKEKFESSKKKTFLYASGAFCVASAVYAAYIYYDTTKFKNDANKIFVDSCERLRKIPGMADTIFHTDIDNKKCVSNPMHMSSYSQNLNTDFIRVMFFASMNNREAVIITEYAKHRTNGSLIPRVIMATIDPNTEHEQVKILEDNRKQTDGDQNLGIIAGDEIPDEQLALVEEKTWDNLMNPAFDPKKVDVQAVQK